MDELKKYLQKHARELELDEPRPQVWQQIRQETGSAKKTNVVMLVTRWAAAACVLVLAGIGIWHVLSNNNPKSTPLNTVAKVEKNTAPPQVQPQPEPAATDNSTAGKQPEQLIAKTETGSKQNLAHNRVINNQPVSKVDLGALNEIESSFTQVINLQRARVSTTPMYAETPEYFNDFKIQIRQMEKDEKVIKSDIAKRGMTDELLDQLINLYQQKLNILKQLQLEMNKTNNRYKQNRGPVDSTRTYFLNI
jgi:cytoskeletal protein RodZ